MCMALLQNTVRACGIGTRVRFCPLGEAENLLKTLLPCGRAAVFADEGAPLMRVRARLAAYRPVCCVVGKEPLSGLFSLPDEVRAVVALGRRSIFAARFFASLRGGFVARGAARSCCGGAVRGGVAQGVRAGGLSAARARRRARGRNAAGGACRGGRIRRAFGAVRGRSCPARPVCGRGGRRRVHAGGGGAARGRGERGRAVLCLFAPAPCPARRARHARRARGRGGGRTGTPSFRALRRGTRIFWSGRSRAGFSCPITRAGRCMRRRCTGNGPPFF